MKVRKNLAAMAAGMALIALLAYTLLTPLTRSAPAFSSQSGQVGGVEQIAHAASHAPDRTGMLLGDLLGGQATRNSDVQTQLSDNRRRMLPGGIRIAHDCAGHAPLV